MTEDAVRGAGIATETIKRGGLGAEIVSQATVAHAPSGEAIVTARAAGAKSLACSSGLAIPSAPARRWRSSKAATRRRSLPIRLGRQCQGRAGAKGARSRAVSLQGSVSRPGWSSEQAQAEAATAAAEARRAQVAAGAANVTRDGRGVIVASPISGKITTEAVSLGAFVQPENRTLPRRRSEQDPDRGRDRARRRHPRDARRPRDRRAARWPYRRGEGSRGHPDADRGSHARRLRCSTCPPEAVARPCGTGTPAARQGRLHQIDRRAGGCGPVARRPRCRLHPHCPGLRALSAFGSASAAPAGSRSSPASRQVRPSPPATHSCSRPNSARARARRNKR